ncbi:hypothetical protein [Pseudomonas haemolytica]|jgi:hypothetical protein|uniref:Uncharacterized protein n=1 Tax=Pseudomonas haemolytica TaxID=2600065 RepID=A0ABS1H193_9PSED|nr:hypothetical protein [Pseudomonas haemolytica]MBK3462664.1 hypothetical protein [Pseudomonas haemolytica]
MFDNVCCREDSVVLNNGINLSLIRTIFDVSLTGVILEFQREYASDGKTFGVSWAGHDYAINNLHKVVSVVASTALYDCEDECLFETQEDFEDARNETNKIFKRFCEDDANLSVEDYVAKLALVPREYEMSSLNHHGFPDIVILNFFKRAISENRKWKRKSCQDSIFLESIINELDLTVDLKKAFVDGKHVNEFEEPEDMHSYICNELTTGRSHESVYSLIETLLDVMCPELTIDLSEGNSVDVYSDSTVISGNIDTLVHAVMSEKFKRIVQMELDDYESAVFSCFDKHFI